MAARGMPELRRKGRGFHAELLQRLDRNETARPANSAECLRIARSRCSHNRSRGDAKVGRNTIHREVVRTRALPAYAELPRRLRRRRSNHNAWSQLQQCVETLPVQGEVLDKLPVDDRADRCVLRID